MKKLISLLCAAALCLLMPVAAFAAETPAPNPEAVQQETAASPRAVRMLCEIGMATNTSVWISVTVYANATDSISVTSQLQRYVNGSWVNYGTSITKSGTGTATAAKTVGVPKGYTYRTKGVSSNGVVAYSDYLNM